MKFIVSDINTPCGRLRVLQITPQEQTIAVFEHEGLAHDYCDFLNDKYLDKEINKEWPPINREERINYHLDEIIKLKRSDYVVWNEHGNGVKSGGDTG